MSATPTTRVLFLAGIGRSGTTLLERTVAEVPGVVALGEVLHLWERGVVGEELCACGRPFGECPFWTAVGDEAFGGWDRVDVARWRALRARLDRASRVPLLAGAHRRGPGSAVREYAEHYARIYRAAAGITGASVVVDSSKQVSLAWCLRAVPDLDLRVVHCLRDARDVARSWSSTTVRPEAVDEQHRTMPTYGAVPVAALWTLHNLEIEALGRRAPCLRVRHEDFVREPVGVTRAVLDLAGVDAAADHVRPGSIDLGPSHSCAGNPMRFTTGRIELRSGSAASGPAPADRRRHRVVTALTAPLLRRYGYLGAASSATGAAPAGPPGSPSPGAGATA